MSKYASTIEGMASSTPSRRPLRRDSKKLSTAYKKLENYQDDPDSKKEVKRQVIITSLIKKLKANGLPTEGIEPVEVKQRKKSMDDEEVDENRSQFFN